VESLYFVCYAVKIFPRLEKLFAILHEDPDLLVVNKPAGLVCHPTKGDEFSSLISRARLYLKPSTLNLQPSTHLVNRLDRETSGVVIIAKNSEAAGELGKIWEARAVQKEYLAIVHGRVRDDHGLIDSPLGRDERSCVAIKDCVRPDGTPAQTEYWVERRFNRPRSRPSSSNSDCRGRGREREACSESRLQADQPSTCSLLRVIPRTGRKHQIRIHLSHLGHPIVGDKLYGGDEDLYLALVENRLTDEQRARLILPHHALHARAVCFTWRGRPVEFSCAPEPWFKNFLPADCAG
jgi:23S rRNA pseudouridine1911/1915/1917 synthase